MKGKEAKAVPVRLRGAANPHQSRVQGPHVIVVDLVLEAILQEEGKSIGGMMKMVIVYMLLILMLAPIKGILSEPLGNMVR